LAEGVVSLIIYFVVFMIVGDFAAYLLGLITEYEWGPNVSLIVFLSLYFLFLWLSWVLAERVTRPKSVHQMADQNDEDKKNMRIMWIASGVVVLFVIGMMLTIGAPTPTTNPATDMSSQSRTAPPRN
jgi:hypothetical protein